MTKTSRLTRAILALSLLSAGAALAQGRDAQQGQPGQQGGGREHFGGPPPLDRILAMTDEQKVAYEALMTEQRAAMKAVHERFRQKLVAILDDKQREKLELLESMHQHGPGGPGGPGGQHGPGGPGGSGPDDPNRP